MYRRIREKSFCYAVLPSVIHHVQINSDDVIADIGCGKGRVINYLLEKGITNKIYGIELDEQIGVAIKNRLKTRNNVEIIIGNVLYSLPPDVTIFYMYNPFSRQIMEEFKNILDTYRSGENLRIVYYNCEDRDLFEKDHAYSVKQIDFKKGVVAHCCIIIERKK